MSRLKYFGGLDIESVLLPLAVSIVGFLEQAREPYDILVVVLPEDHPGASCYDIRHTNLSLCLRQKYSLHTRK